MEAKLNSVEKNQKRLEDYLKSIAVSVKQEMKEEMQQSEQRQEKLMKKYFQIMLTNINKATSHDASEKSEGAGSGSDSDKKEAALVKRKE